MPVTIRKAAKVGKMRRISKSQYLSVFNTTAETNEVKGIVIPVIKV